jgi:hypothetical protein
MASATALEGKEVRMTTPERVATAAAHRLLPAIAVAAVAAGCGSAPATSPPPPTPVVAEATKGPFVLRLELPKANWESSETITGQATLSLVGVDRVEYGTPTGETFFSYQEVHGNRSAHRLLADYCHTETMEATRPLVTPLQGGQLYEASPSSFQKWFRMGPSLRLPAGAWQITATAWADTTDICGGKAMEATVEIRVTD